MSRLCRKEDIPARRGYIDGEEVRDGPEHPEILA
jgi:hypothetical protein